MYGDQYGEFAQGLVGSYHQCLMDNSTVFC